MNDEFRALLRSAVNRLMTWAGRTSPSLAELGSTISAREGQLVARICEVFSWLVQAHMRKMEPDCCSG